LGVLWGIKQHFIGLDFAEKRWLSAPGNLSTHILFGKLRVFSFYSDAGQFGAAMAHAGLVSLILSLGPYRFLKKALYALLGLLCIYGLLISGTRGAMFVCVAGFLSYLFLSKNIRTLLIIVILEFSLFYLLKFTYIGQGIYEIRRIRSALDPNDPSLLVRFENQKILARYLADKPFGGGVGSSGYWGNRFSPNTLLANTPTDSWFVQIWAEQGIIGLVIYISGLLYILFSGARRISKISNLDIKQKMIAIHSGTVGIAIASYGNRDLNLYRYGFNFYDRGGL